MALKSAGERDLRGICGGIGRFDDHQSIAARFLLNTLYLKITIAVPYYTPRSPSRYNYTYMLATCM